MEALNLMPGAFPGSSTAQTHTQPRQISESSLHQNRCEEFTRNEASGLKTQLQRHMVGQLDSLAYILIVYQLIRHTYFSCYITAFIDCCVQILLHAGSFANGEGARIFDSLLELSAERANRPDASVSHTMAIDYVVKNTKHLIFLKSALVMSYHVSNCVFWLQPLVISGKTSLQEHGPFFFMSFLGESMPEISENTTWWSKLWRLGLVELVFLDVMILMIQLTLYQSIYRQSTISPSGLRLDEEEIFILRAKGISADAAMSVTEVPDILHVKLHEALWGH